jgi:LPS O-antigen subunit length determinant protein (WzzB/FepE family)
MNTHEEDIELMDYLNVIWRKKWLIILPTLFLCLVAGVVSFILPPKWDIDAILLPSKFFVQTTQGQFEEVIVADPKQIAGQINEEAYNRLISVELNLDMKKFPKPRARNLSDTKLVSVKVREKDVEKGKAVLSSLLNHLKQEFDRKINVEIKSIDSEISTNEISIKKNDLLIKEKLNAIKLKEIEKIKIKQEILSAENKLKISEERFTSITEEMKSVKKRIDEIEEQLKKTLDAERQGSDAIGLLLYSNEVQNNLRYYNTLDEKLSTEKITQENSRLFIKDKSEQINQVNAEIELLKIEIDKIKNETEDIINKNNLLNEKKGRIDYTQIVKEPTQTVSPVWPRKRLIVTITGVLSLLVFTVVGFFLEYLEKKKAIKNAS